MLFHLILIIFVLLTQNFTIIIQEVQESHIKLLIRQIIVFIQLATKVINIWNNIPAPIKQSNSVFIFNKNMKKFLISVWLTLLANFTLLYSLLVILK